MATRIITITTGRTTAIMEITATRILTTVTTIRITPPTTAIHILTMGTITMGTITPTVMVTTTQPLPTIN